MNLRNLLLSLPLLLIGGCGGGDGHDHDHSDPDEGGAHDHQAVNPGGVLVELGEHQGQLEVALDAEAGSLTLWIWDAEVEKTTRLTDASIPVEVTLGDETFTLACSAQESALSGEKVGDSSKFKGDDQRLKGAAHINVRVAALTVRGLTYSDLELHLPPHDDHDEDEH